MSENPSGPRPDSTDGTDRTNGADGAEELAPVSDPAYAVPPPPPTTPAAAPRARLWDRVFRFRSVLAVAAAGVIVGGAAGAGLTAIASGTDSGRPQMGHNGFGPGQAPGMPGGGAPGMPGGPGGAGGAGGAGGSWGQSGTQQAPGQAG